MSANVTTLSDFITLKLANNESTMSVLANIIKDNQQQIDFHLTKIDDIKQQYCQILNISNELIEKLKQQLKSNIDCVIQKNAELTTLDQHKENSLLIASAHNTYLRAQKLLNFFDLLNRSNHLEKELCFLINQSLEMSFTNKINLSMFLIQTKYHNDDFSNQLIQFEHLYRLISKYYCGNIAMFKQTNKQIFDFFILSLIAGTHNIQIYTLDSFSSMKTWNPITFKSRKSLIYFLNRTNEIQYYHTRQSLNHFINDDNVTMSEVFSSTIKTMKHTIHSCYISSLQQIITLSQRNNDVEVLVDLCKLVFHNFLNKFSYYSIRLLVEILIIKIQQQYNHCSTNNELATSHQNLLVILNLFNQSSIKIPQEFIELHLTDSVNTYNSDYFSLSMKDKNNYDTWTFKLSMASLLRQSNYVLMGTTINCDSLTKLQVELTNHHGLVLLELDSFYNNLIDTVILRIFNYVSCLEDLNLEKVYILLDQVNVKLSLMTTSLKVHFKQSHDIAQRFLFIFFENLLKPLENALCHEDFLSHCIVIYKDLNDFCTAVKQTSTLLTSIYSNLLHIYDETDYNEDLNSICTLPFRLLLNFHRLFCRDKLTGHQTNESINEMFRCTFYILSCLVKDLKHDINVVKRNLTDNICHEFMRSTQYISSNKLNDQMEFSQDVNKLKINAQTILQWLKDNEMSTLQDSQTNDMITFAQ